MKRFTGIALAAILSLSLVAPALAAEARVDETLTVASAFTVTGIPSSISYGTVFPGETSQTKSVEITVSGNAAWKMSISGTPFTGSAGGSLPASNRNGKLTAVSGSPVLDPATANWMPFGTAPFKGNVWAATGSLGTAVMGLDLQVWVPASMPAQTFTGFFIIEVFAQ